MCQNAHNPDVEGPFKLGVGGVEFVEIKLVLALLADCLIDELFTGNTPVLFVKVKGFRRKSA